MRYRPPSNYKGCKIFQEILQKRNSNHFWNSSDSPPNKRINVSYAQATRTDPQQDNRFNSNTEIINVLEKSSNELNLIEQNKYSNSMLKLLITVLIKQKLVATSNIIIHISAHK